ncbi:MAG: redoxin domain-containing protein [Chloroflexi bacterium]|nr:redoxin domain-containing protein [Chloroflexota bacterium]
MEVTLALAFIAGLASFLSPCVLPLVPAYIGYMGGRVTYTVAAQANAGTATLRPSMGVRFSTLLHSLAFVLGFSLVFVSIGLLSTAFVSVIGRQNVSAVTGIISRAGGVLIILFGLHFMGLLARLFSALLKRQKALNTPIVAIAVIAALSFLTLWIFEDWLPALPVAALLTVWMVLSGAFTEPAKFWVSIIERIQQWLYTDTRRQMIAQGQQGYLSSVIMGVVFSAGWTPCIGPIYGTILTMAAAGGDVGQAGTQLAAYSLGLGIPFILAALMMDSAQGILRRLNRYLHTIELAAGAFLIVIGVLVASGQLQSLSQTFANQFADFSYRLEECVIEVFEGRLDVGGVPGCINTDTAAAATVGASGAEIASAPQAGAEVLPTQAVTAQPAAPMEVVGISELASSLPTASVEESSALGSLGVGSLAPLFTAFNESGESLSLQDLRGQVVLLNFWATWCGPCRIEMPGLQAAYESKREQGFVVVGINNQETVEDVAGFRLERGLTFPLLMDEQGTIQEAYGIRAYPSTFIIDAEGLIDAVHYGPLTPSQIEELVGEALS